MTRRVEPPLEKARTRLAGQSPLELQRAFIRNYFGNILQDYFDACELRRKFPKLDEDTEEKLRTSDGQAIADWLFERTPSTEQSADIDALVTNSATMSTSTKW